MTRTWWDNEEILHQFREWLTQTGAELEALDGEASEHDAGAGGDETVDPLPDVGLLQVVEAFTALRHELKLETRSTRGLQETVQSALQGMAAAQRSLESVQAREREAALAASGPIIEDLVALDEALGRGARVFAATHRQMTESAPQRLREALDESFRRLPWWRRRLFRSWHQHVLRSSVEALARVAEEEFASLMQGYGLIRSRVERALQQHSVRRIECVGRRVDPAQMTVVELVDDPHAEPETVVDEVRPGYLWEDRVIRFAEVRAARPKLES